MPNSPVKKPNVQESNATIEVYPSKSPVREKRGEHNVVYLMNNDIFNQENNYLGGGSGDQGNTIDNRAEV